MHDQEDGGADGLPWLELTHMLIAGGLVRNDTRRDAAEPHQGQAQASSTWTWW